MHATIQRGQVYWVALGPVRGSEMSKTRPCIVLSSDEINRRRHTAVIVPLTSTPELAHFPLVIEVPSAGVGSKVRTEQIRNVDKSRLKGLIGRVSTDDLHAVSLGVRKVLGLG